MRKQAASIKEVLKDVLKGMSGEKKQKIDRIKEAWLGALEPTASAHAQPVAFKAKRLVVSIDSSAWMYELNLKKPQIHRQLNEKLKKDDIFIKEMVFMIGEV